MDEPGAPALREPGLCHSSLPGESHKDMEEPSLGGWLPGTLRVPTTKQCRDTASQALKHDMH